MVIARGRRQPGQRRRRAIRAARLIVHQRIERRGQLVQSQGQPPFVVQLTKEHDAFLEQRQLGGKVAQAVGHIAQGDQRIGQPAPAGCAGLAENLHTLGRRRPGPHHIRGLGHHRRGRAQGLGPDQAALRHAVPRQRRLQPGVGLAPVAADIPEPSQGHHQPQAGFGIGAGPARLAIVQRRADVVEIRLQPVQPARFARGRAVWARPARPAARKSADGGRAAAGSRRPRAVFRAHTGAWFQQTIARVAVRGCRSAMIMRFADQRRSAGPGYRHWRCSRLAPPSEHVPARPGRRRPVRAHRLGRFQACSRRRRTR